MLVVRVEGAAPQVMDAEAEHNHLERISLLSAYLASGVEHVAAIVEVKPQVGLGGAIALKYSNMLRNSPQTVSLVSRACVITSSILYMRPFGCRQPTCNQL